MYNTIFFDLDGVIVDSEPIHAKAKKITLDHFGIEYDLSLINQFKGQTDESFFKTIIEKYAVHKLDFKILLNKKQSVFLDILPEMNLVKGFNSFINLVKSSDCRTALVSSTSTFSLDLIDKEFDIKKYFEILITEEDTQYHKPHPAPYLSAFDKMKTKKENTLIIEDSPNGIQSAKEAGGKVYALTTTFTTDRLSEANQVFNGYKELSNKVLSELNITHN